MSLKIGDKARLGRPADRREEIVAWARNRIVGGGYAPGDRFVGRAQIGRQFEASTVTVQSAMDELIADGMLLARGTSGTFVPDRPPFLNRFGLVHLQSQRHLSYFSHFYQAMEMAAEHHAAATGIEFEIYRLHGDDPREPDYARLLGDFERRKLAGVVFTSHPAEYRNSSLIRLTSTPRTLIGSSACPPNLPGLNVNRSAAIKQAMTHIQSRGRRRLAAFELLVGKVSPDTYHLLASQYGLTSRRQWWFPASPHMSDAIRHYVEMLLDRPGASRPDVLFVMDDNLVSAVSQGVAASGLRVPDHVEIVSLANFPSLPETAVPVTWLGFDIQDLIGRAIETLRRLAKNEPCPDVTLFEPLAPVQSNGSVPMPALLDPHTHTD